MILQRRLLVLTAIMLLTGLAGAVTFDVDSTVG
jgi:hypothetical protein